jgi:fumarylacetoacetase
MVILNETHEASAESWVQAANAERAAFPIQNLPFGIFKARESRAAGRVGVAIGDAILDVAACHEAGLLPDAAEAASACSDTALNALMNLAPAQVSRLRRTIFTVLRRGSSLRARVPAHALVPMANADLELPARIGDYSDFFASIYHATNAGKMFRPDSPLFPNYKYLPIAYHGRASSIVVSGTPVMRPLGQSKTPDATAPTVRPSQRLDYEVELGVFVGRGNNRGEAIPLARAHEHVFGACLVNDWSARDIQTWEYQPLGPFLGKSFGTTVSPWVVTLEALAPFRTKSFAKPSGDPQPLPYLQSDEDASEGGLDISVEAMLSSAAMRASGAAPHTLARTSSRHLYWTVFQMIAHHTMNGCNLRPGDLIASGTLSGPTDEEYGSLLELTLNGTRPFTLPEGETRTFLEDGDEVIFSATCQRQAFRSIGFGEARGRVMPARAA